MTVQSLFQLVAFFFIAFGDPEIHIFEEHTPGGILTERYSFYLKGTDKIKHGDSILYFDDGRPQSITEYFHGKKDGKTTTFYERIERKDVEFGYKNGVRHGMSRWWSPKGELLFECEYRANKPWLGRASTGSTWSIGSISTSVSFGTIEYRQGERLPNTEKSFTVEFQTQYRDDLPDVRTYLRWFRYEIESDYPHLKELPPYEKVPFLIEWCANKGSASSVAHSQLIALTRVDFGNMSGDDEAERAKEIETWKHWWQNSGKDRLVKNDNPVLDREAWQLVARNRNLEVPADPIVIPDEYTIEWNFRSGDYGGIFKENLTLTRTENQASLVRTFSTKTGGKQQIEEWHGFSPALADRTTRALGYLIDNPWLLNDDIEINRRFWKQQDKNKGAFHSTSFPNEKLAGRESYSMYYPGVSFTMNDGEGNVWWNADPWSWNSPNPIYYNFSAQPINSSTFPFVTELFPESKRFTKTTGTGWKEMEK